MKQSATIRRLFSKLGRLYVLQLETVIEIVGHFFQGPGSFVRVRNLLKQLTRDMTVSAIIYLHPLHR